MGVSYNFDCVFSSSDLSLEDEALCRRTRIFGIKPLEPADRLTLVLESLECGARTWRKSGVSCETLTRWHFRCFGTIAVRSSVD